MASSPTIRRDKQRVSYSPVPGIAIGVLAAVAGFAATRALCRKRQLPNRKNEAQANTPLLKHDKESETDGGSGLPGSVEGTVSGACEIGNHVVDLDAGVGENTGSGACEIGNRVVDLDAGVGENKDGALFMKVYGVEEGHEQKIGVDLGEEQILWERANENGEMSANGLQTVGDNEGDVELFRIDLKVKAHRSIDGASLKVLQDALRVSPEGRGGEEDRGEDQNCDSVVADEDTGEGGDDERSTTGQPPSPVLSNGNLLDLFDELDISISASNYLSDSVSECSMQEANSAQVKPLEIAEEPMEAVWTEAKHACVGSACHPEELKVFAEDNNWSDKEKGSKETEVLETDRRGCCQSKEEILNSVIELTASSVGHDDLHEALPSRIGSNGFLESLIDEVNVEVLPGTFGVPTEGIKSSRINLRVLSDTRGPCDCNEVSASSVGQAPQASIEREDFKNEQSELASSIPYVNGSVIADDSSNDPSISVGCNVHNGPNLQSAHKRGFHDGIDIHYKTELQPSEGQLLTDLNAKGEADLSPSMVKDIHSLENHREVDLIACKDDDFHTHSLDSGCLFEFGSADYQMSSNKEMGLSASSLIANLNLKPCEEFTLSTPVAQPVLQEEASMQPDHCDVTMVGVTHNTFDQDSSLNICNDMLVLSPGGSEEVSQEMPSLTSGSREVGFYNEENLNGSCEGGRLPVQEETLHEIFSSRSNSMKWIQHEEKPVIQVDMDDGSQGRASEPPGCESGGDDLSKQKVEISTDDQSINSEISHITGSMQELLPLKDCSMDGLKDEEPGTLSGRFDIGSAVVQNMMGIDSDQPICPPVSSLESRKKDFADNLKCSFGLAGSRKDSGKPVEIDDTDKGSWMTQQQEIEEMTSAEDASNKPKDFSHLMHSQHSSRSADREIEQPYAHRAVSSQSRGFFSTELLRYLPVKIGLICLHIAIMSFILQYFMGLSLNRH